MVANPMFYPVDFSSDKKGNSIGGLNTVESAIAMIDISTIAFATHQSSVRRDLATASIRNESKTVDHYYEMMPPGKVGLVQEGNVAIGKKAFVPGEKGILRTFDFLNESFTVSGIKLSQDLRYPAVVGNKSSGKIGGGINWDGKFIRHFDKIRYYPSETIIAQAAELSESRVGAAGQMGNDRIGVIAGGANSLGSVKKTSHNYNHDTESVYLVNTSLSSERFAPQGGVSSKYAGYILGGCASYFAGAKLKTWEKINYTNMDGAFTPIGTNLDHSHIVHASFSNVSEGFIVGGSNSNTVGKTWEGQQITKIQFSTEQASLMSLELPFTIMNPSGGGNSEAGMIFTGWVGDDLTESLSSQGIFKFKYATQSLALIEVKIGDPSWDMSTVSEYSAGLKY